MNLYNFFNLKHSSNLATPNAETIKQILNDVASPVFKKMQLSNEKNVYRWCSDYNAEGVQTIIQFKYRATSANFLIGTNFKFMPVINKYGKLVFKKNQLQLYISANSTIDTTNEISIWNEKFFKQSLQKYLAINSKKIQKYLASSQSIQQNIAITTQQLKSSDSAYKIRELPLHYTLSFLHAKLGQKEKAIQLMHDHLATGEKVPENIFTYLEKV